MRRARVAMMPTVAIVVAVVVLFLRSAEVRASTISQNCSGWTVVSSPNPGTNNVLDGVSAIADNDVWAVGYSDNLTLTEHWDGSSWSAVPSANVGTQNVLDAVSAVSTNNVWAVGFTGDTLSNNSQTLTENWNGTTWLAVPSPTPGTSGEFTAVSSVPESSTVWAVGHYTDSTQIDKTLIEQWNGTSWQVIPSPNKGVGGSDLLGVVALSANDAWAVGTYSNKKGNFLTLTEHWNGKRWSLVASPNVLNNGVFWAVTRVPGSNNVWAVGTYGNYKGFSRSLTALWNGSSWNVVSSPSVANTNTTFFGTSAASANNVWAVALTYDNSGLNQAFTEHWDGDDWDTVSTPNVEGDSILTAVTVVPNSSDFWAVGVSYSNGNGHTVTQHTCS
ncbi:MAG TPA: hypothetical protein VEV19_06715 [Ktedonobacteraceae bacterium]|nr:hypothetical protein [Ktedonobacteraceae bacterium]